LSLQKRKGRIKKKKVKEGKPQKLSIFDATLAPPAEEKIV